MMQRCLKVAWLGMLIALGGLIFAAPGYAVTLSFTQCPAVGADTTGCEFLITQSGSGFVTTASSPDKGPYDGVEDTLIGFQNNTTGNISSLVLSSTASANGGIFNFDGDGACGGAFITCTGGDSTGYGGFVSANGTGLTSGAGNNVTYGNIAANNQSGTVFFTGGIPAGGSAWFSLEDVISVNTITPGGAVPEPSTLLLIGTGLVGLVRLRMK